MAPTEPAADGAPKPFACPHCGSVLLRAHAGADGRVLCLNCGQRFAPARPDEGGRPPENSAEAVAGASPALVAEPVALSYGYLRALGILALVAGTCGLGLTLAGSWNQIAGGELPPLLVALMCLLAGAAVQQVTAGLIRTDALVASLVWRRGRLRVPLAHPQGTALGYILPPAALGGLAGLTMLTEGMRRQNAELVGLGLLTLAGSLLLAFGAENLRHFFWRMAQWGARLRGHDEPAAANAWRFSAWLVLGVFLGLALIAVGHTLSRPGLAYSYPGLLLLAAEATLAWAALQLLRNLGGAMHAWGAAEGRARFDPLLAAVRVLGILFGLSICTLCVTEWNGMPYQRAEWSTFLMYGGVMAAFGSLGLLPAVLAGELIRWRRAQEERLGARAERVWTGYAPMLAGGLLAVGLAGGVPAAYEAMRDFYENLWTFAGLYTWTQIFNRLSKALLTASLTLSVPLFLLLIVRETRRSVLAAEAAAAKEAGT